MGLVSWFGDKTGLYDTDWDASDWLGSQMGYGPKTPPPTAEQGSAQDPNVAFQAQQNYGQSRDFLGRLGQSDAEHRSANLGQNELLGRLKNTATNPNAPSVAGSMLAINNDRNARGALGSAAGVGGANAFAARRQALQSIAQGNIGTAQNAALLRAKEAADANAQSGQLLGQMSGAADRRYGQDVNAAGDFAGLASSGQQAQQGMVSNAEDESRRRERDFINKLASAGASGGASLLKG